MKTLLWLDDIRNPNTNDWLNFSCLQQPINVVWVKTYEEFIEFININGLPDGVNFDHDLGVKYPNEVYESESAREIFLSKPMLKMETGYYREGTIEYETGFDCAKWLVNYCIDNNKPLPKWYTHSANPAGKENIDKYLTNFLINS